MMNYFELFDIPVQLQVDKKKLTAAFIALQKKYHPDFYGQQGEEAKAEAEWMSALVNKAWQTFGSRDATVAYVLQLKGLLQEEEKYALPPDFLMEVMELNEMKMDGAAPSEISQKVQQLTQDTDEAIGALMAAYSDQTHTTADLLAVKDWYFKKKYLDRLMAE